MLRYFFRCYKLTSWAYPLFFLILNNDNRRSLSRDAAQPLALATYKLRQGMTMKNIFFFDSMLTPKIITFVYWLLLLGSVLSGVTKMFAGYDASFVYGLFIIVSGCVGARIWCELLIVLFKINGNLQKIANGE